MNREKLKRIVLDIEATEKAIKDLSSHKRDLYADNAKEFEPKVLRKIIQRRKMDPEARTRDDDLLDQYESALGMTGKLAREAAAGERTYDEAAEEAGVSRRTMARHVARAKAVPKSTENDTPHDPETGEITQAQEVQPADGGTGTAEVTSSPAPAAVDLTIPERLRGPAPENRRAHA